MSRLDHLVRTYLSEKDAYKIIELRNTILILVTQEKGEKFVEILENLYEKEDDPAEKQKISKLLLEVVSRTENSLETLRVIDFLCKTSKLTINFQQSISTFKSILERHFKEDEKIYEKIKKFHEEIMEKNVSQYPQQCRLDFLYISNFVVESYIKGKIDHVEIETMCESIGGEKDPRNLLKMFDLLAKLAKNVAKEEKEFETIAKTYSIYYPIQFVPPKRDKIHITPLQLKKELLKCFIANQKLSRYSMEILLDSLYSEYNINEKPIGVIEDTLYFLKRCKEKYKETFSEYSKNFLEVLKVELLEDNYEESNLKPESECKSELDKKDESKFELNDKNHEEEKELGGLNILEVKKIGERYFKEWKYIDEKIKLLGEILKLFVKNLEELEDEELIGFLVNLKKNIYSNYSVGYIVGILCENQNLHGKIMNHIVLELLKDILKGEESENGKHRENIINILGIYIVPKMLIHFQGKTVSERIIKVLKRIIKKEVDKEFKFKCLKLILLGSCIVSTKEVEKVIKMTIKPLIKESSIGEVCEEGEQQQEEDKQYKSEENNNNKQDDYEEDDTMRTILNVEENELGSDMGNDSTQDEGSEDKTNEINLENEEKIKKEIKSNMEIIITIYKCHNKSNKYIKEYLETLLNEDFDYEEESEKQIKDLTEGIRRISYVSKNKKKIRVSNQMGELLRITLNRYGREEEEEKELEKLVKRIIILAFESLKRLINKCLSKNKEYQKKEKQLKEGYEEYENKNLWQEDNLIERQEHEKNMNKDKIEEEDDYDGDEIEDLIEYANLVTEVFESKGSEMAIEIVGRKKMIEYFAVLVIWYRNCLEKREDSEIILKFFTTKVPRILSHIGENVGKGVRRYLDPTLIFMKLYFKKDFGEEHKGIDFRKYMNNIRKEDVMPLNLLNLEALFMMKGQMKEIKELLKMGDMSGSIMIKYVQSHYQVNFKKMIEQIKILNYYEVENIDYEDMFFFMTPISVKKVNPIIKHQLLDIRKSFKEKIIKDNHYDEEKEEEEDEKEQKDKRIDEQKQNLQEMEEEREEMLKLVIEMIKGESKIEMIKNEVKGMEGDKLLKVELLMSMLLILLNKGVKRLEEEHLELVVESMTETLKNINKWKEHYNYELENKKEQKLKEIRLEEDEEEERLDKLENEDIREYVEWCCDKYKLYVQSYLFEVMSNMNNSKYEENKRDKIKNIISKNIEVILENVMSIYKKNKIPFSRILTILNLHSIIASKFIKVEKEKKIKIIKKSNEFLGDPNKKVRNIAVMCRHQWINNLHD